MLRASFRSVLFLALVALLSGLAIWATPARATGLYSLTPSPEPPTHVPPTATVVPPTELPPPPTALPPTATPTELPPPPTELPPPPTELPPPPTELPPPPTEPPATVVPPTEPPPTAPPATSVPPTEPPVTAVPPPPSATPTPMPPVMTTTPDLVVHKTADRPVVRLGDPLRYTITVQNVGTAPASDVQIVDVIPAWLRLIEARSSQGRVAVVDGAVVAQVGDLAPGASATVTIDTVVVALDGTLANTAKATTTTPGDDPGNNTSTVVVQPPAAPAPTPRPAGKVVSAPPPTANSSLPHTAIGDALPLPLLLSLIGLVSLLAVVVIRRLPVREEEA